tara:strand:+ start:302 stop:1081 length:780 start_codon:yes stop_codon:yes gene_type:complete
MQRFNVWQGIILILSLFIVSNSHADGIKPIPSLHIILEKARSYSIGENVSFHEIEYAIKKFYYQIQYQGQKLEILNEVKGHFEKSISKAEEKYEIGEEDISQSDITKLKLGLAGTLNDIYGVETDLKISRLSLSDILKNEYKINAELANQNISPLNFEYDNFEEWIRQNREAPGVRNKTILLKKAFLKINEAKKKMQLALKNRKMTRALLVSEVANYDFGIGDPGDLFQALIIYTRVLSGYYESVYKFNLSIAELDRDN